MTRVMLVGNPNCGKTTLFNALTGENQRVGNWPGVTVEKKTGVLQCQQQRIELIDLPGVYSLASTQSASQDEQITSRAVVDDEFDVIINVVDACHFERHFYLTSQLLELGKPLIIALNMADIAHTRGIEIDTARLSDLVQCPVILLQAHRAIGMSELKHILGSTLSAGKPLHLSLPTDVCELLANVEQQIHKTTHSSTISQYLAYRALEGDTLLSHLHAQEDLDIVMADARYQAVHQVATSVQKKRSDASEDMTAKIDRFLLHRFFALPIFLGVMYALFVFAIGVGGAFQDFFDKASEAIFVNGLASFMQYLHVPNWLIGISAYGIGRGVNTTLTFIPVIASMYFFLSILESSGYMARAAFVVDKIMRCLGLPGKAFVPMIVGFGCNVPAIMSARTLDSEQDRLLTILMSPFMSCSARLAIYTIFVTAFFPSGGQNIVFSLYVLGILMAVLTGFMLRRTLFKGKAAPLIIELPVYHWPSFKRLLKETMLRLRYFLVRAGKLIIPICMLLGGLNTITVQGGLNITNASSHTLLSSIGQLLTPIFSPIGIHQDNWPATVGLLTGMLAKEVVVGSLNALYEQIGYFAAEPAVHFQVIDALKEALWTIPNNVYSLFQHAFLPLPSANQLSTSVYGVMYHQFDGKVGAYAYLLFILLYIPCVSTMAVIRQEAGRNLMWFSIVWSLIVAYAASVIFYQTATFSQHPQLSLIWIMSMLLLVGGAVICIRMSAKYQGASYVTATS